MKNLSFLVFLLLLSGVIFTTYSCNKADLEVKSAESDLFPEPSEEIINGELFIDGVSQREIITDFDIEGVEVTDGRLAFIDHDAMMDAIHKLADYNTESVVAWSEKIGFNSLFTELTRIEQLDESSMMLELKEGILDEYFTISEEEGLELSRHSHVHARIFSVEGIVQVGDYIGSFSNGLSVWTSPDFKGELITALQNHYIPDDRNFIVYDDSAFDNTRDITQNVSNCPLDASWTSTSYYYKHPSKKRRLNVVFQYKAITSPAGNGLVNYDAEFWVYSQSRKGKYNKYKTTHYLSIDIRTTPFSGIPLGTVIVRQNTDIDTNTKYGNIVNHVSSFRNVTSNFLTSNGERIINTVAGSSGMQGTSASHRGMGGRYIRLNCN